MSRYFALDHGGDWLWCDTADEARSLTAAAFAQARDDRWPDQTGLISWGMVLCKAEEDADGWTLRDLPDEAQAYAERMKARALDADTERDEALAEVERLRGLLSRIDAALGRATGGEPCAHKRTVPCDNGDTVCVDCGAVAPWPVNGECGLDQSHCDWPACMRTGCPGPLGDDVLPVWSRPAGGEGDHG